MKPKKASLRVLSFFIGAIFIFGAIYFLLNEKLTYGGILGLVGVLIISAGAMN